MFKKSNCSYEVHLSSEGYEGGNKINKQQEVRGPGVRLSDLTPGLEYSLRVVARAGASGLSSNNSVSEEVRVKMFQSPESLVVSPGARDMNVTWRSPEDSSVAGVVLQSHARHQSREQREEGVTSLEEQNVTRAGQELRYSLTDLTPGLCYILKLKLR